MTVIVPPPISHVSQLGFPLADDELRATLPVIIRKRIAFGECDPAGIVYTPRFADFLLLAWFWFQRVIEQGIGPAGISTPMRGLELDFRGMLAVGDTIDMVCRIGAVRDRTFDFEVEAVRGDGIVAFTGKLTPIAFDPRLQRSVPLSGAYRARLVAYAALQDGTTT